MVIKWVSGCKAVEVSGSAGRGRPKKTWEEVIKMDLKELAKIWLEIG